MEPKKEKSSKKGLKLTKAQKAKLQKEEEERRLREEEEARLQAEKQELERLERERKQIEIERLELKDSERREDELNELSHLLEKNHIAVTKWKNDGAERERWERYMRCDGTPDPAVQQDINTYISLWRDDPEVNITALLKQNNFALQLIEELQSLLRDATHPEEGQKYQEAIVDLQELIHSKHLLVTEEILKTASTNIDAETGNMQTVVKDENITLCLWANFKKNPRFKGFNFEEAGLGFELPKHLAVSNVAVRILHTRYDHLSFLARIAHPRSRTSSDRTLKGGAKVPDPADVEGEAKEEGETKEENETEQEGEDKDEQPIDESEGQGSAEGPPTGGGGYQLEEGAGSEVLTQMEVFAAGEGLTPPAVTEAAMKHRVHVVDLMQYAPVGGVIYCEVFHLPPQIHQVNDWEIRQVMDQGLQVFPYPTETSNLDNDEVVTTPPVGVSVTLPDSVVFLETPRVARWDDAGKLWRMDGITDVSYQKEQAKMSFKVDSFQPFVLMQQTYVNFPFRSWELKPLGQDSALFTINGTLTDLSITVQGNQCMLHSEQAMGLSQLMGKWMSGPALQKAMIAAGINIFVNEYADNYISTHGKDPLTERAAYEQIALFASACAFSRSKWNTRCGPERLVMQVCEHHGPDPVPTDSWSLYLLCAQRSQKLGITETSESFSPDHSPGSEFHSTFIHMLQDNMSADGITRARQSNFLFVNTVQSLLCATRPLMHS